MMFAVETPANPEITRLLGDAASRERSDRLLDALYPELKRLAQAKMARERADHTLSPTALVHEAWLRLVGAPAHSFENRAHFFAVAAEAMRRILIEHARAKSRQKRDGGARVDLDAIEAPLADGVDTETMLALDAALTELEALDAAMAQVAVLRWFGGLSVEETAAALETSPRSVNRLWTQARAWLLVRLAT
jgi:RNA polymerase sigma factor (TIGR02999 family)